MSKKEAAKIYSEIRRRHPEKPFGDHWEGVGYYVGDKVWCDPEYLGMPGEIELFPAPQVASTRSRPRRKTTKSTASR